MQTFPLWDHKSSSMSNITYFYVKSENNIYIHSVQNLLLYLSPLNVWN